MKPLVSVIIPCYNQAAYLAEAVESVYAQSYRPLQVLVINDGSTDDTATVILRLQKQFPELQNLTQENAGVSAACNAALERVKGELLIRLDADDYLPADYIEKLYTCLSRQPERIAFAYCDAHLVGAQTGILKAGPFSVGKLLQENYIHVSALVRKAAARKVGYFHTDMQYGLEDWDFWLNLVNAGYRGVYCPETFLYYRQKETAGRNSMARERYRAMRQLVYQHYPRIYGNPLNWLRVQGWRLRKRLERWDETRAFRV